MRGHWLPTRTLAPASPTHDGEQHEDKRGEEKDNDVPVPVLEPKDPNRYAEIKAQVEAMQMRRMLDFAAQIQVTVKGNA